RPSLTPGAVLATGAVSWHPVQVSACSTHVTGAPAGASAARLVVEPAAANGGSWSWLSGVAVLPGSAPGEESTIGSCGHLE
ncbi:MAG: hypothetical protein ACYDDZ_11640, partial [Acidimicrobiales bacterium]